MLVPGFWDDQERAQQIIGELKITNAVLNPIDAAAESLEEIAMLAELGEEAGAKAVEEDLEVALQNAIAKLEALEFQVMLGGENDNRNAFLSIQAGAGGVDATDFAEMLMRMYLRWGERQEIELLEIELLPSDEGGIRHCTLLFRGPYAYGKLKAERGVHRLVRISPFDAQGRRHTSFAAVEVMPEFEEEGAIQIDMEEVRVDTYRASGAHESVHATLRL